MIENQWEIKKVELASIKSKLKTMSEKNFDTLDQYIETNVIDFESAKEYLKLLSRNHLALLKYLRYE
jgi:hypothetical protein